MDGHSSDLARRANFFPSLLSIDLDMAGEEGVEMLWKLKTESGRLPNRL
jgi:hypothetical protein